jgi:hypothetical protein
MKKIILVGWFCLISFFFCAAQPAGTTEKLEVKVGNELTYHVKSKGKEYDFIVTIKALSALNENAIVFDWQMTAPVNKKGTITIGHDAATNSKAFYNWFADGDKKLDKETSVFIAFMLNIELVMAENGDEVKIKVDGASAAEESFTMIDNNHSFTFTENGTAKTIKTLLLKNKTNGKTLTIYNESTNSFIVDMSIGFDISLQSVK